MCIEEDSLYMASLDNSKLHDTFYYMRITEVPNIIEIHHLYCKKIAKSIHWKLSTSKVASLSMSYFPLFAASTQEAPVHIILQHLTQKMVSVSVPSHHPWKDKF